MPSIFQEDWFRMSDIRRRRLSAAVWIPLRQSETLAAGGEQWRPGSFEETMCVGTLAILQAQRHIGARLGWGDIGLIHTPRPYAFGDGRYKPADQYWFNDQDLVGIELVLENELNRDHPRDWQVNQDLVIALGLIQEGDSWLRVDEGYEEVIRQRRDRDGRIAAIEIRAEYLRDYLCARGLALRLVQYRQRIQIIDDASHLPWHDAPQSESSADERFELRTYQVDQSGGLHGSRVAVFKVWRTDVDLEVDVPIFGPETDTNTASESYDFVREGQPFERVMGELWRDEWVEPATVSERVRGDTPAEQLYYSIGAAGEKAPASELDNEDVGQYLWFKAEVVEALLAIRGSSLAWYTADTGSVSCSPSYDVHFGINEAYRINVYAYDIARLPMWQQRIWHGFNISPDGPPSRELQDAQFRCETANTKAPEVAFPKLYEELNALFEEGFGAPLFKPHEDTQRILEHCHRFRALKENGTLALAKDIARLTVDSIDIGLLLKVAPLGPKENRLGGLKMLERVLQLYVDKPTAFQIMGPLHITYGLRLGDAHLPSAADLQQAFSDLGVSNDTHPLEVGATLIGRVCDCLHEIGAAIYRGRRASEPSATQGPVAE